jgi:hypothetical protein
MNYNIMCYLNRQLVPVDMEGESLPDAINNLINDQGENLGPIVMVKQAEFSMGANGRISGVKETI